jgi:hypothetical protein
MVRLSSGTGEVTGSRAPVAARFWQGVRVLSRRGLASCLVLVIVAGSLSACLRPRATGSACGQVGRYQDGRPAAPGQEAATASLPPPVPEALWVADSTGTLRAFDGRTNQVSATLDLGTPAPAATALVTGGGLIWAYQYDRGLAVVDPVTARVVRRVPIPPARPLAKNHTHYLHGALWVAQPGQLWRVGSASAEPTRTPLPTDFDPTAVAATSRWLWLAGDRRLVRVDPATGTVTTTTQLPAPAGIGKLLGTPTGLFAVGWNQAAVWVLDPDSGALKHTVNIPRGELISEAYADDSTVWATGNCGDVVRVSTVEPTSVQTVKVSGEDVDSSAVAALGSFWVCDQDRSEVVRIDLSTATIRARIPVLTADPDEPEFAVVAGRYSVWVVDINVAKYVQRVDPATNRSWQITTTRPTPANTTPVFGITAVVAPPP